MEIPGELKSDLQRTLLGPLSLATELFGVLIPGCVFVILTCIKRGWAPLILNYQLIGYKTKVVLVVLASYVVGKVSLSVIRLVSDFIEWIPRKIESKKQRQPLPANATALQSLFRLIANWVSGSSWVTMFLGGLVGASILANKSELFHHYTASEAEASFHLNTGLLLILTSLISGDGHFRALEALAGGILLAGGIRLALQNKFLLAGSYGMVLNDYLKSHSPEQVLGVIAAIAKVVAVLSKAPAGTNVASPASPEQASEPSAEDTEPAAAESATSSDASASPAP